MSERRRRGTWRGIALLICLGACAPQRVAAGAAEPRWLLGPWRASAFGGSLLEEWREEAPGVLQQRGIFVAGADTSYSQVVRMESIAGTRYLIALPSGSPPLIFRAASDDPGRIVFENDSYENPYRIVYEALGAGSYSRTLFGRSGGEEQVTRLRFERR